MPNRHGGWDGVKENHDRPSVHTDTLAEAITRGREIVRNLCGGELWVQNGHGQLIDSGTIGPGPESPTCDRK